MCAAYTRLAWPKSESGWLRDDLFSQKDRNRFRRQAEPNLCACYFRFRVAEKRRETGCALSCCIVQWNTQFARLIGVIECDEQALLLRFAQENVG